MYLGHRLCVKLHILTQQFIRFPQPTIPQIMLCSLLLQRCIKHSTMHSWTTFFGNVSRSDVILTTTICDARTLELEFTKITNWAQDPFAIERVSSWTYQTSGAFGNAKCVNWCKTAGIYYLCSTLYHTLIGTVG